MQALFQRHRHARHWIGLAAIAMILVVVPTLIGGVLTDARYILYDGSDPEFSGVYAMDEPFLPPTVRMQPLKAAKDAVVAAVDIIASGAYNDQVGAVAASSIVNWTDPLSPDSTHVRVKLRGAPLGVGGSLDLGLAAARVELLSGNARAAARKVIVMVTDGVSDPTGAVAAAQAANAAGITVFVVGVGTNLDSVLLDDIAAAGGGTSLEIDASTPSWVYGPELQDALASIARNQIGFSLIR